MSLANYTDLKTAVFGEFRRPTDTIFEAAVPDLISRGESKINSVLRLREQETVSTSTYDSSVTDRRVAVPTGFIELLNLKIKDSTAEDTDYIQLEYINPDRFHIYIESQGGKPCRFTLTDRFELDRTTSGTYTLRYHYIKKWDIATDTTNWLLTNHPDVYLMASFVQCALYLRGDHLKQLPVYKSFLDEAMEKLNKIANRSRNDATLNTYEFTAGSERRYSYNILSDGYRG